MLSRHTLFPILGFVPLGFSEKVLTRRDFCGQNGVHTFLFGFSFSNVKDHLICIPVYIYNEVPPIHFAYCSLLFALLS